MSTETCVLCGAEIPEGRQACLMCEKDVFEHGTPPGYMTVGEIAQRSFLKGYQIKRLIEDHGITVGERGYISISAFYDLKRMGMLSKYRRYPLYSEHQRKIWAESRWRCMLKKAAKR